MLLYVTKRTLRVIKDPEMGDGPGFSRWVQCHHGFLWKEEAEEMERCFAAGFKDGGRGHVPRNAVASRCWKRHGNGLPCSFQKEPALPTSGF